MAQVSPEILKQLEEAQAKLAQPTRAAAQTPGPALMMQKEATMADGAASAPSGNATANYVLVDHFFGSAYRTLWAYANGAWHAVGAADAEEQGVAQVAFASNRVDVWWDNNNQLTIMRCWKNL